MNFERFNSNTEHDFEKNNFERQKRKLTGYYLSNGNADYIFNKDDPQYNDSQFTPEYEQAVVENMAQGVDYSKIEYGLLNHIAGPDHFIGSDGVFSSLSHDKHQKRILTYMTGEEWNNYNNTSGANVGNFLKTYPTPIDFENDSTRFLEIIKRDNGEGKFQEYCEAMEKFKNNIYGKKYEYYKVIQDFHREAEVQSSFNTQEQVVPNTPENIYPISQNKLTELNNNETINILRKTTIEGDPISLYGRPAQTVTAEKLYENNLGPKYKFSLENIDYNVSRTFKLQGGRDAVICYVNTPDGKISARGYYRSNSQGVWRYLPDYEQDDTGKITWFGKGSSEQQLTLPVEVQENLNSIAKKSRQINQYDEQFEDPSVIEMFFGTAKKITRKSSYLSDRRYHRIDDALTREVENTPRVDLFGDLREQRPEEMHVEYGVAPNFDDMSGEFEMESDVYGKAIVRYFESNDKSLIWSIIEDAYGRACVGGVEVKSKITSTGLRESWANTGDFTMPLYEYSKQDYGLGDINDKKGYYLGMWKNCLSRMPIIRAYKSHNYNNRANSYYQQNVS